MQEVVKETTEQESGKEQKNFDAAVKTLISILGSDTPLKKKPKLPKGDLSDLVSELFKEERNALASEIKTEVKELIKNKHEMDKAFEEHKSQFEKLKKEKMKSFTEAAQRFRKIESIGEIEKSYYETLKTTEEAVNLKNEE